MNLLDLLIVLMTGSALLGGWRLGFLARATSWIGLGVGFTLAVHFLPDVVGASEGFDPDSRLLLAAFVLIGGAFLGQAVGLVVGAYFHHALPVGPARTVDRSAGAALGLTGVLLAVWMMLPSMAQVQGWPAEQATTSRIARAITTWAPDPPNTIQALARIIGDQVGPEVLPPFRRSPDPGVPPETALDPALEARVRQSTVRVEGRACDRRQSGSGFTVAPGVVVTNAHVVAGEDDVFAVTPSDRRHAAQVMVFDTDRDLAVLRVPGLGEEPLPIGEAKLGELGAVFGYPGGGSLAVAPAKVSDRIQPAIGTDIYNERPTERDVLVLAAQLAPGYSGGAVVDTQGEVVGVAFAIARDRSSTAFALHTSELEAVLAAPRSDRVDTGDCLR